MQKTSLPFLSLLLIANTVHSICKHSASILEIALQDASNELAVLLAHAAKIINYSSKVCFTLDTC